MADSTSKGEVKSVRLTKEPGRARTSGAEFEYKLAALIFLRAKAKPGLQFQVASNVQDANPIDDLFLRLRWCEGELNKSITYFVQLKHSEARKRVSAESLIGKSGDFSIRKYLECYKKFSEKVNLTDGTKNENFLFNCDWDSIRFVIYTNRPVDHKRNGYNSVDFPFVDLLLTGSGDEGVFCFSEKDEAVWNLMEGNEDNNFYRNQFLPRLLVCSEQANAKSMDSMIEELVSITLGGNIARKEHFCKVYLSLMHDWWDRDKVECLSDTSLEIEKTLKEDSRISICEDLSNAPVVFSDTACEEVKQMCSETRVLHVVSPGVSETLRCAKFQQVFKCMPDKHYLILRSKTFSNYPLRLLQSTCSNLCDTVIAVVDIPNVHIETMLKEIKEHTKLIIVTSASPERWQSFVESCSDSNKIWEDIWEFDDLELETQLHLMTCSCFSFQGHEMSMEVLLRSWPFLEKNVTGKMISTFIADSIEKVEFGKSLPAFSTLYQERSVEHATTLHHDVLDNTPETEQLMLYGFPEEVFPAMYDQRKKQNITLVYEVYEDEQRKSTKFHRDTHWLAYENGNIIWNKTEGHSEALSKYVQKKNMYCVISPMCSHKKDVNGLMSWDDRFVLLTGDPGIGKTTFLVRLAHALKQKNPVQWVILMFMKSLESVLQRYSSPENISIDDVINLMAVAAGIVGSPYEHPAKEFLRYSVENEGNVVVLVDAVDEVCPNYKNKAFRAIQLMAQTKVSQIWVTARTNLDYKLREAFCTIPLNLAPFDNDDQSNFLRAYIEESDGESIVDTRLEDTIEALRNIKDGKGSILGFPLHVEMVAELFCDHYHHSSHGECEDLARLTNLLQLYHMFVDKKMRIFQQRHGMDEQTLLNTPVLNLLKRHFTELHMNSAVVHLFGDQENLDVSTCRHFLEQEEGNLDKEKTGIISNILDGKPIFVHQSFAEYFAARWLVQNFKTCRKFISKDLFLPIFQTARKFFDSLLAEGFPLHEAVLENRMDDLDVLLSEHVNTRDAGGRLALHLAASYGRKKAAEQLLQAGSDVSAHDQVLEWTPLRYADVAMDLRVAELLMQYGASRKDMPLFNAEMDRCIHSFLVETAKTVEDKCDNIQNFLLFVGLPVCDAESREPHDVELYEALYTRSREDDNVILRKMFDVSLDKSMNCSRPLFYALSDGSTRIFMIAVHANDINASENQDFQYNPPFVVGNISLSFDSMVNKSYEDFSKKRSNFFLVIKFQSDQKTTREISILHVTANMQHYDAMKALLKYGVPVNSQDSSDETPLHAAARANFRKKSDEDCFNLLIQAGADCNMRDVRGRTPCHCLFGEMDVDIERFLQVSSCTDILISRLLMVLRVGGKLDVVDGFGRLPIHYASARGCSFSCCFLIRIDDLQLAIREATADQIIQILNSPARAEVRRWDVQDRNGCTPLYYAVVFGHGDTVRLYLKEGADFSWRNTEEASLLHMACQAGSNVVEELLESGMVHIHEKDANGLTPLHYLACRFKDYRQDMLLGYTKRDFLRQKDRCRIFSTLLKKGCNVHILDGFSRTPLHYASSNHLLLLVELFLDASVSIDIRDVGGQTALNIAAANGRMCIVKMLLQRGADCKTEDKQGRTPLFNAARNGSTAIVRELMEYGADLNTALADGTTPLIVASCNGHEETVRFFLGEGVEYRVNELGQSALHAAAHNGHLDVAFVLLRNGVNVNYRDHRGFSALQYAEHYAVHFGDQRLINLLMRCGAKGTAHIQLNLSEVSRSRKRDKTPVRRNRYSGKAVFFTNEEEYNEVDSLSQFVDNDCEDCNLEFFSIPKIVFTIKK